MEDEREITQLKDEVARLNGENTQLKDENAQLKDENAQLKAKVIALSELSFFYFKITCEDRKN